MDRCLYVVLYSSIRHFVPWCLMRATVFASDSILSFSLSSSFFLACSALCLFLQLQYLLYKYLITKMLKVWNDELKTLKWHHKNCVCVCAGSHSLFISIAWDFYTAAAAARKQTLSYWERWSRNIEKKTDQKCQSHPIYGCRI